jgi:flagellar hook-basal body complex protein FliE
MIETDIARVLAEMRTHALLARGEAAQAPESRPEFTEVFRQALDKVNSMQQEAADLAVKFELGDDRVDLAEVVIAQQKATIAFQAAMQVRNRFIAAYQEIMNMPV